MKKIERMTISNRDLIAGQPALCVREMFLGHDEPFTIDVIRAWLLLDKPTAIATADHLIEEGYLEFVLQPKGAPLLTRTALATFLRESDPMLPLTNTNASEIVLALLSEIQRINHSPIAHRVESVKLFGGFLCRPFDEIRCVEVEIIISTLCTTNETVQVGLQELAASYAEDHGRIFASANDRKSYSQQSIIDRLYSVHKKLSIRFRHLNGRSIRRRRSENVIQRIN